ncbi:MAG: GNAT family protein [Bacteroidales bacterium]|nr:GNAT family protein [Bacteroidales bacterium]
MLFADDGLYLNPVYPDNARKIFNAISSNRDSLSEYVSWVNSLHTEEDMWQCLMQMEQKKPRSYLFEILHKYSFAGLISVQSIDHQIRQVELGYWLLPEYQARGLMSKCISALTFYLFKHSDIEEIHIRIICNNHFSKAVALKSGFRAVEQPKQELDNGVELFVLTKNDWLQYISF